MMGSGEFETTVIIPTWNTRRWLKGCLDGLRAQHYRRFRVLVVDNGSTDGSVAFLRRYYPEVDLIAFSRNLGFAPAVNAGIHRARTPYVALLNVDTVPRPDWLGRLVDALREDPSLGCVASRMLNLADPTVIDDAGDTFSWYGSARKRGHGEPASRYRRREEVFSACAGAALYRKAVLEEVGGFDESFQSYLEDIDLGFRIRLRGYRCLYVPEAEVLHQGHGAQLARARYVYLMTRNRLAVLTKNLPASLLRRHAATLLYGQFYFFLVYKHPFHSLAGTLAWLFALPRLFRARRAILSARRITDAELERWISDELGEPSLREIARSWKWWPHF